MARKKKVMPAPTQPTTPPGRSTLHEVLRSRKAAPHRRRSKKRTAQKLKRELEGDG